MPLLPSIDEYKRDVRMMKGKLKKPWIKEFLTRYYPDKVNDEAFIGTFKNFVFGNSWKKGFAPPGFMEPFKEFYQSKLKEYERSASKK